MKKFLLSILLFGLFVAPQLTHAQGGQIAAGAGAGAAVGAVIGGPVGAGVGAAVGAGFAYLGGWLAEAALAPVYKGAAIVLYFIVWILYSIGGVFLQLMGSLVDVALDLNHAVITNQAALTGWITVRDLANLAIVIAVIFIAVATIIGREEYGIRKFLGKLVVMALLINFTFVISGLFVDFSTVFTKFFYNNIVGKSGANIHLSDAIASSVGASGLVTVVGKNNEGKSTFDQVFTLDDVPKIVALASDLFFLAVFMFVAAIIMGNIAVLYLIRYVAITILLVLAPLAWIMYAFPGLEHYAKQWWKAFLEWIFFLPVSMFFIYLAVLSMLNFTTAPDGTLVGKFTHLALGFGLLMAALMAGKFVGGGAADVGLSVAGKMKGVLTGATGLAGGWAAGRFLRGGLEKDSKTGEMLTRGQRFVRTLGGRGYFGAAGAIRELSAPSEKLKDFSANLASLDNEALKAFAANPGRFLTDQEKGLIGQALAKRHMLHDPSISDDQVVEYAKQARQISEEVETDVLKARPSLAGNAAGHAAGSDDERRAIEKVMKKISSDERKQLGDHDLNNETVRSALRPDEIASIITSGTEQARGALIAGLKKDVDEMNSNIQSGLRTGDSAFVERAHNFRRKIELIRNNPAIPPTMKRDIGSVQSVETATTRHRIATDFATQISEVTSNGARFQKLSMGKQNKINALITKNTSGPGLTDSEDDELRTLLGEL